MKYLLRLLGYEVKEPSLLFMHIADFTHSSWLTDIHNQSRFEDYIIKH